MSEEEGKEDFSVWLQDLVHHMLCAHSKHERGLSFVSNFAVARCTLTSAIVSSLPAGAGAFVWKWSIFGSALTHRDCENVLEGCDRLSNLRTAICCRHLQP